MLPGLLLSAVLIRWLLRQDAVDVLYGLIATALLSWLVWTFFRMNAFVVSRLVKRRAQLAGGAG